MLDEGGGSEGRGAIGSIDGGARRNADHCLDEARHGGR
jgi:hypothetical protein